MVQGQPSEFAGYDFDRKMTTMVGHDLFMFGDQNFVASKYERALRTPEMIKLETITYAGTSRKYPALAVSLKRKIIYVTGGRIEGRSSATAMRFSLKSHKFKNIASMVKPREKHSSTILGHKVYVFWGLHDSQVLDSIELMNVSIKPCEWELVDS